MAEYIEREKIWPALNAACVPYNRATAKAIEDIPAADVRPVRRGKWATVYDDFMKSNYDTCSCCGKEYFGAHGFNFCPNCGCAMEES